MISDQQFLRKAWQLKLAGKNDEANRLLDQLKNRMDQRTRVREGGPLFTEPEIKLDEPIQLEEGPDGVFRAVK